MEKCEKGKLKNICLRAGGMAQAVEHLPSKFEAMSSNSSTPPPPTHTHKSIYLSYTGSSDINAFGAHQTKRYNLKQCETTKLYAFAGNYYRCQMLSNKTLDSILTDSVQSHYTLHKPTKDTKIPYLALFSIGLVLLPTNFYHVPFLPEY
jgi:hypothetical protein